MENIEPKRDKSDKVDSLIFKMIMTLIIIFFPLIIFHVFGFHEAIITSIIEVIFLLVANREDLLELKEELKSNKEKK